MRKTKKRIKTKVINNRELWEFYKYNVNYGLQI